MGPRYLGKCALCNAARGSKRWGAQASTYISPGIPLEIAIGAFSLDKDTLPFPDEKNTRVCKPSRQPRPGKAKNRWALWQMLARVLPNAVLDATWPSPNPLWSSTQRNAFLIKPRRWCPPPYLLQPRLPPRRCPPPQLLQPRLPPPLRRRPVLRSYGLILPRRGRPPYLLQLRSGSVWFPAPENVPPELHLPQSLPPRFSRRTPHLWQTHGKRRWSYLQPSSCSRCKP